MFARFGVDRMQEDFAAFEFGLSTGRGMVELEVTPAQFAVLKEQKDEPM